MDEVNGREHRVTRRAPVEMLAEEQTRLHRVPDAAVHGGVRGDPQGAVRTRRWSPSVGSVLRSAHPRRAGVGPAWRRRHEIVVVHHGARVRSRSPAIGGRRRATRRSTTTTSAPRPAGRPGQPRRPRSQAERRVPGLGDGARMWLIEAAAAGTSRVKVKMADAVTSPNCTGSNGSTGRSVTPRRSNGSPTRSRLDPRAHPVDDHVAPTRTTRCTHPRAPGPRSPRPPRGDRVQRPPPALPIDGGRRSVATVASAAHAPRTRTRGDRPPRKRNAGTRPKSVRPCSPKSSPAGAVDQHPPHRRRVPDRQDLRHLGRDRVVDPGPDPAIADDPGMGATATRTSSSADRPAPAKPSSSKRWATRRSDTAATSNGSPSNARRADQPPTASTTPPPGRSARSCAPT